MFSISRRRKRHCFGPMHKKKLQMVKRHAKKPQSSEQIIPQVQCSHGDLSEAPPTKEKRSGREERKRKRRRGGETEKKKIKTSELGPNGSKMEIDDSGMGTAVTGMEAWGEMGLPLPIIRGLKDLGFTSPTEIQRQAIPVAMDTNRDVIGAAETGSGKTLAFSIPILNYIITNDPQRAGILSGKRGDVMMRSSKNQEQKKKKWEGAEVIDLNIVLHEEENGGEESEEDGQSESESETSLGDSNEGAPNNERGLVTSLDNIPEDVFLKMIDDDVTITSSEKHTPISNSRDDIVEGSHEPSDDVTVESHDQARLLALILTPTRELALQIQHHIQDAAKYIGIKVCVLVGGMADAKQQRMLSQHPPIVVATPGRLWKLMSEGHPYLMSLESLKYFILDEADRMIEFGHYQELSWILERVNKGAGPGGVGEGEERRQTFVFSATLSLPRRCNEKNAKVRRRKNLSGQETIENLVSQVGLREDAAIVDVARATGTTETLSEMKIMCSSEEKFLYLYYFLLLYKGRTLVFVNSISTLQKLRSLLNLLHLNPLPLHARMQQRQRLKNFDRFGGCSEGVLLASDVAARGLDFPHVDHVIHYDVPFNSDLYVHRSGRTARAQREGLSLILIGQQEMTSYKNICKSLRREGLPSFPMETSYLPALRRRVSVARRLEASMHRRNKRKREGEWLVSTASAMELEWDGDWYGTGTETTPTSMEVDKEEEWKSELKRLLEIPIIPRSVSMTYPTQDEKHTLLNSITGAGGGGRSRQIITTESEGALEVAKRAISRSQKTHKSH